MFAVVISLTRQNKHITNSR